MPKYKIESKDNIDKMFELSTFIYSETKCTDKDFSAMLDKLIEILQDKRNRYVHNCPDSKVTIKKEFGDIFIEIEYKK